jgi:hypothetical protein
MVLVTCIEDDLFIISELRGYAFPVGFETSNVGYNFVIESSEVMGCDDRISTFLGNVINELRNKLV